MYFVNFIMHLFYILYPIHQLLSNKKHQVIKAASYKDVGFLLVGVDGLLRFGHARGLTPHRGVIQDPRAASLPRRPAKRTILNRRNGRFVNRPYGFCHRQPHR